MSASGIEIWAGGARGVKDRKELGEVAAADVGKREWVCGGGILRNRAEVARVALEEVSVHVVQRPFDLQAETVSGMYTLTREEWEDIPGRSSFRL